jgi:hypothetical protein
MVSPMSWTTASAAAAPPRTVRVTRAPISRAFTPSISSAARWSNMRVS